MYCGDDISDNGKFYITKYYIMLSWIGLMQIQTRSMYMMDKEQAPIYMSLRNFIQDQWS
jgi:hypothetical protein